MAITYDTHIRSGATETMETSFAAKRIAEARKARDYQRAEIAGEWIATLVLAPFHLLSRTANLAGRAIRKL